MKLGSVPGITSVSLRSLEQTTAELRKLIARLRKPDPALEAAAVQAAELAHEYAAAVRAAMRAHERAAVVRVAEVAQERAAVVQAAEVAHEQAAVVRAAEVAQERAAVVRAAMRAHEQAAVVRAAEVAHEQAAVLLALVEHPAADPGLLVGGVVPAPTANAAELRCFLADAGGPGIREVTQAETARGYPVVLTERILPGGAQLQAVVLDRAGARAALFTLHSPSGRGWTDLAAVAGRLVTSVDFTARVP
ncbi:hypothetical protein [Amycolatopsis sp. 195334CR]|uniref:hypothetical protein n=1 Tax=Amycolatopsis sp. 195334CR TaxID=2814588 RepID=UPI001A907BFE|nr:hypothetical protein [Amycolatopsis sp. 195334CR]MBN6037798.1 hypothetical protein [Amycolatopsis sp. 195334CR]